ncbi:hypothetical protein [Nostocoides vanveenii]|uniref:Uncharacterized protein n=1 Tax=Nostocoides vanveenii TaxID=330835 RepID=A0ABP4WI32_9MICO
MDRRQLLIAGATTGLAGATTLAAGEASAAPFGFNSTFTSNKLGWSNVYGNWMLRNGNLHCDGIPGYSTSVKHSNNYSDYMFQARMKRSGNYGGNAANRLIVRGNPSRLNSAMNWRPSYLFQYANAGWFSVWLITATGAETPVVGWTNLGYTLNNYVTISAYVAGDYLALGLNGIWVWSGYNSALSFGQVGMGFWTAPGYWGKLDVDYSRLGYATRTERPTVTFAGKPTPGGSVHEAPH